MKTCFRCKIEKEVSEFRIHKRNPDGLQIYCKNCAREIDKAHYLSNREFLVKKKSIEGKDRYRERREKIDEIKRFTPCKDCGKNWHPSQMQFDHLRDKDKNVSDMLRNFTWERIQEEMNKCELVCANCHCLRTYQRSLT